MKFGPKRGNFLCVFENFFKNFGFLLGTIILVIVVGTEVLYENVWIIAVVIFSPITKILSFLTTYYSIDEEKLLIESGIINKRKTEIPISTITTVDFSQNLIDQIFKVYKLKINNDSGMISRGNSAEMEMVLNREDSDLARSLLTGGASRKQAGLSEQSQEQIDEQNQSKDTYKASMIDFIMKGLLQSKMVFFWTILSVLFTGTSFMMKIFTGEDNPEIIDYMYYKIIAIAGVTALIIFFVLLVYLLSIVYSLLSSVIKYYDFTLDDMGKELVLSFGLINKKKYTISREKISGFVYEQSILMRKFKSGSLQMFASGYGGGLETQEIAMLYPFMKEKDLKNFIQRVMPEIPIEGTFTKPKKQAFRYFFFTARFIASVILLLGVTTYALLEGVIWAIPVGVLPLVVATASVIMEYRNSGMFVTGSTVGMVNGGFNRKTYFIKAKKVEVIRRHTTAFKDKKGIGSISIGYLAPVSVSNIRVKNLPCNAMDLEAISIQ